MRLEFRNEAAGSCIATSCSLAYSSVVSGRNWAKQIVSSGSCADEQEKRNRVEIKHGRITFQKDHVRGLVAAIVESREWWLPNSLGKRRLPRSVVCSGWYGQMCRLVTEFSVMMPRVKRIYMNLNNTYVIWGTRRSLRLWSAPQDFSMGLCYQPVCQSKLLVSASHSSWLHPAMCDSRMASVKKRKIHGIAGRSLHDPLLTMTMTHSKNTHIHRMKAWPYRQECRDHGPTKKNLFYW